MVSLHQLCVSCIEQLFVSQIKQFISYHEIDIHLLNKGLYDHFFQRCLQYFVVNYESDFYTQFVLQMNFSKEEFLDI